AARTLASKNGLAVTMVSAEPCPAYVPHLLPELATGKKSEADLFLLDQADYAGLGVSFRPGAKVERLSAKNRVAFLSNGETVEFDKALIASGAAPHVPENLAGFLGRCGNVITMKRIADARALKGFIEKGATRIAIIGAGRVGMLLAEALKSSSVSVSVIEIGARILATMLEEDMAEKLHPILAMRRHLRIHTGAKIAGIECEGAVAREIRLSDGTSIPCEVIVVATGVAPNTLFMERGPADGEGVAVDNRMETADPGIYAAGDVVSFETVTGRREVGQLVQNARAQGEIAARNIAGEKALCPPSFIGNVVKLDPFIAARIGDIEGSDRTDFRIGRSFARATVEGQTVVGIQFVGDPEDLRGLAPAVLKKFTRADLSDLFQGRLDLGLAPLLAGRSHSWA
ncbi:MAG: Pyr redox 2 protein, partial [Actinobacteria bacterium]|nr:Pyr redox 2 protein [Actinomycetota bacterium]